MSRSCTLETAPETCSTADSSVDNTSRNSEIDNYADKNSSAASDLSELAIHTLLVETRARDLDREVYQDPESDRYPIQSGKVNYHRKKQPGLTFNCLHKRQSHWQRFGASRWKMTRISPMS